MITTQGMSSSALAEAMDHFRSVPFLLSAATCQEAASCACFQHPLDLQNTRISQNYLQLQVHTLVHQWIVLRVPSPPASSCHQVGVNSAARRRRGSLQRVAASVSATQHRGRHAAWPCRPHTSGRRPQLYHSHRVQRLQMACGCRSPPASGVRST